MSWKVRSVMEVRKVFLQRLLRGERMTDLCREYGISRKTGYKFKERFALGGEGGLADRSRAPLQPGTKTPEALEEMIVLAKKDHPTWGSRKLKVELAQRCPGVKFPSVFTIHAILDRRDLVKRRIRKRRIWPFPDGLTPSQGPNDVWCADFKGQFRLGDRSWCYPLTISDHYSRFLIGCDGMERIDSRETQRLFEDAFRIYGLPRVIRTDNGVPFATLSISGLSTLAVWWMRLGIQVERIAPGHPEQNGRHERMHLTLKQETTRPAASNILQQQERFDCFREEYNDRRPHEALEMQYPKMVYTPSDRAYPKTLDDPEYPLHDRTAKISSGGHIAIFKRHSVFIGKPLAYQKVGLREVNDGLWQISFLSLDLGFLDEKTGTFTPCDG
jgi:transposase InsO family protein